eukprot:83117-Chlamydomonas_euryale.AAC.1
MLEPGAPHSADSDAETSRRRDADAGRPAGQLQEDDQKVQPVQQGLQQRQRQRARLDPSSNAAVAAALSAAVARASDPGAAALVRSMLVRAMAEA